jgi:hypothetical protein
VRAPVAEVGEQLDAGMSPIVEFYFNLAVRSRATR